MDNRKRLTRFLRANPGETPPADLLSRMTRQGTRLRSLRRAYLYADAQFEATDRQEGRMTARWGRSSIGVNALSPQQKGRLASAVEDTKIVYTPPAALTKHRLRRRENQAKREMRDTDTALR